MQAQRNGLDFIVIGAQKAGTTSLFQYLRRHPQVALPAEKERFFFSHDGVYRLGWEVYIEELGLGLPEADGAAVRRGTVTPHYMAGGVFEAADGDRSEGGYDERTVPSRIRERLPDVRLVAILRDPVERAISHHRMEVRKGWERRSFEQAVEDMLEPDTLLRARRFPDERLGYVVWGEYGRILAGYFDVFERDQILVLFTEELERSPLAVLRRIHEFIGVSVDHVPDNLGVRYAVTNFRGRLSLTDPSSWFGGSSPLSPQRVQRRLWRSSMARSAWRSLSNERRERINRRYARVMRAAAHRETAARWDQQAAPDGEWDAARPSAETLRRLQEHYAADTAQLAELLGVSPPWQPAPESSPTSPQAGSLYFTW